MDNKDLLKEINEKLYYWLKSTHETGKWKSEIETFANYLISFFNMKENEELKYFFQDNHIQTELAKPENKIFRFMKGDVHVDIQFDTIHGVKGETHTATLFLETFNRVYDMSKVIEFIISDDKKQKRFRNNDAFKKRLPLAYVAMTRPTHFLCLAIHKDRFNENCKDYFDNNDEWKVEILN